MFDVIKFLNNSNVRYWTEGKNVSPGWINTQCLFCGDNSNHLGWNPFDGYTNCWKCGRHSLEDAVMKVARVRFAKAVEIIASLQLNFAGINPTHKKPQANTIALPGKEMTKFHRQYLTQRGFDDEYIESKFQVLGTGPMEEWEGLDFALRLIIPIYFQHQLVAFQGRDITGKQKERYKGIPVEKSVMNYKHILYNWDSLSFRQAVVVEGITDVWRMGDGFVATFGTSMTPAQVRLLSTLDRVLFLFDPEPEAQTKAQKYATQLSSLGVDTSVIKIPDGKDPGDLSPEEALHLRRELGYG